MSWFVHWFDSSYYHTLYKNRNEKEAQKFIDNLVQYLQISNGGKLIDIACGKGRHAFYFNSLGFDVVGIDLSPNSIRIAKKKMNPTLQFSVHDMREIYQKEKFDIATNLFTSFGYFEKDSDEQKSINAMTSNLKAGGILVIDFMNVEKVIANLLSKEQKIIDGITFNINRKLKNGYIIKDICVIDGRDKHYFQEKVKALTLTNFTELVCNAGLKIIDVFGNYKLDSFNFLDSERLILICNK